MAAIEVFFDRIFEELEFVGSSNQWLIDEANIRVSLYRKDSLFYLFGYLNEDSEVLYNNFVESYQASLHNWALNAFDGMKTVKSKSFYLVLVVPRKLSEKNKKHTVFEIEEDPYFFKKYVLNYDSEIIEDSLKEICKQTSVLKEIQSRSLDQNNFLEFVDGKNGQASTAFLYHVLMKVPTIPLGTQAQAFENLETYIDGALSKKGLLTKYRGALKFVDEQESLEDVSDENLEKFVRSL